MNIKQFNWKLWGGFLLSIFAFLSYYLIFVWFPITRDFPWANMILIGFALVLLILGLRRAFAKDRRPISKVISTIGATLGILVCAMFLFVYFVAAKWMPNAAGAPKVGQKAPEFTLNDSNNKPVSLTELLTTPINGKAPKGAVLVFYRGYW